MAPPHCADLWRVRHDTTVLARFKMGCLPVNDITASVQRNSGSGQGKLLRPAHWHACVGARCAASPQASNILPASEGENRLVGSVSSLWP